MDNFTKAKVVLNEYRYIKKYVQILKRRIKKAEKELQADDGIRGVNYNVPSTSKSYNVSSIIETMVIKTIEDLEKKKKELSDLEFEMSIIYNSIKSLNINERRLIKLMFLHEEKLSYDNIASILHVSTEHTRGYLKDNAIKNFSKAYFGKLNKFS